MMVRNQTFQGSTRRLIGGDKFCLSVGFYCLLSPSRLYLRQYPGLRQILNSNGSWMEDLVYHLPPCSFDHPSRFICLHRTRPRGQGNDAPRHLEEPTI